MQKKLFYGYIIVSVIFVLQIIMFGPRVSFGVFIKPITADFDWTRALVAGAFSLSSLIQALSSIFMGWLNDRKGPRFVLTICGILVGAGLSLMFFVDSAWQLYLFYVALVGVGMGSLVAPQMSTIARWFVKKRNIMTAFLLAGGGLGGLIGPPLITWLIYEYSWRNAYLFIGITVFLGMILAAQFLKRDPAVTGELPDGESSKKNILTKTCHVEGLTPKQALGTNKFWLFALSVFCVGFCLWTILVHVVPYAIDRGISPGTSAIILSAMNGAQPAGSIIVGLLADKIGNRKSMALSIFLLTPVLLLMLPMNNPWLIGILVMIMAFGLGGISVVQSSVTAELFGMKAHGTVLGYTVFTFSLGGAAGTYTGGLIFDTTGSYQLVFLICGSLVVAAIIMALYLDRLSKNELYK